MSIISTYTSPLRYGLKRLYKTLVPKLTRDRFELKIGCSDYYKNMYKKTGCIFIHVPKAAGTSIAHALYGRTIANHYPASLYYKISKKEFKKYFVFSVVRNPWDRLVSAYEFIKQGGTKYVKPPSHEIYNSGEFSNFESFVTKIVTRSDFTSLDMVFQHQHYFICDANNNILVDYVGRFEQLDELSQVIKSKIGFTFNLPSLNKTSQRDDYSSYYSRKTKDLVAQFYGVDIELFKYKF